MIIAIDGHSSCGKSTLAKALAKALNMVYVDSGAMYRAVTLYFLENDVDLEDEPAVQEALDLLRIDFRIVNGQNHTFLNGVDVEHDIRQMPVSKMVSPVAAISAVRRAMVAQQQAIGKSGSVVMDGRDIGTVVFPDADLKIFMTADLNTRVERRYRELLNRGSKLNREEVKHNLHERDRIDSTREDSPLRKADDAVLLDSSNLNPEQQLQKALALVEQTRQTRLS